MVLKYTTMAKLYCDGQHKLSTFFTSRTVLPKERKKTNDDDDAPSSFLDKNRPLVDTHTYGTRLSWTSA